MRGIFGHALKVLACQQPERSVCTGCPLREACPYAHVFEPAGISSSLFPKEPSPVPYVIEPPEGRAYERGEPLIFHVVLIGQQAITHMPLVMVAFRHALRQGFGDRHTGTAELETVIQCLPEGVVGTDEVTAAVMVPEWHSPFKATLSLLSPLRLQTAGKPASPEQVTPRILLGSLLWRALQLQACYDVELSSSRVCIESGQALLASLDGLVWHGALHHGQILRRSQRQQKAMTFDVLVGDWMCETLSPDWYPLLYVGQWLHLGRGASFGLGQYTVNLRPAID